MRVFLDFEASSLAKDSYPIEVGWVFEDGTDEAHLIRPIPAWRDWDRRAEALHHISRAALVRDGEPAEAVANRMLATLAEHELYASAPSWDGKWLSTLLRGAGLPRHALRLRKTDEAQIEAATEALRPVLPEPALPGAVERVLTRAYDAVGRGKIVHRALDDARRERELWLAVRRIAGEEAAATAAGAKVEGS